MKQRYVFHPALADGNTTDYNLHGYGLATIINEYLDNHDRKIADVLWPSGIVTFGHFVSHMICPKCLGRKRLSTGQWCPECAREEWV